jgi:NAD(P)H-hydrate repair Nnr-like enzyme with NAD(P)H-hydrate epimerase domain
MVSQDAGLSDADARARVTQVQSEMRQTADNARKAASAVSLWTAFALMFSAAVAVAAAISARWMDDRITFSFAPRR